MAVEAKITRGEWAYDPAEDVMLYRAMVAVTVDGETRHYFMSNKLDTALDAPHKRAEIEYVTKHDLLQAVANGSVQPVDK